MVVLTAAVGEEILIDGRIRIRILAIQADEARLEVDAPDVVRWDRKDTDRQQEETSW